MSGLRIKIPKPSAVIAGTSQATESSSKRRTSTKRRIPVASDEDYDVAPNQDSADEIEAAKPSKRARTDERNVSAEDVDVDIDYEGEDNIDVDSNEDDTRFLPEPGPSTTRPPLKHSSSRKLKADSIPSSSRSKRKAIAKRAVVLSDDEDEEEYEEGQEHVQDYDDDFEPEPALRRSAGPSKGKGRGVATNIGKGKGEKEKEMGVKDERKALPPTTSISKESSVAKRVRQKDDEESVGATPTTNKSSLPDSSLDVTDQDAMPPPIKKRKLPTIKKNKIPGSGSTASTPTTKSPLKGTLEKKDGTALPLHLRKPAATVNSADFDLRDKSVYAQLFTKPGGTTPNSGLNRKEKEEERRKELNRMRDEARAKRAEEAKQSFDLQAAHDKISRFEEKLHARKSMAVYPNILGAAFKEAFERKKRHQHREREGR